MSGMDATVSGVDALVAACEAVAEVLTSSETATDAAALVAAAAGPDVPRLTGHLASTETIVPTTVGAVLEWTAVYARPVYALRPWLPDAIAESEPHIATLYADRAALAWS